MAGLKPHLSLNVTDVDRAAEFYGALFGASPSKRRPGYAKFELDAPSLNLALNETADVQGRGAINHAGIQVESADAVLAAKERLTAAGLATFDELDTTCCYALQDNIWVRDPDGTPWEIFVVHADAEERGGSSIADESCGCGETGCSCAAKGAEDVCCA